VDFLIGSLPLGKWPKTWEKGQEYTKKEILPDIIFHDRHSGTHNYMMIEVEKSTNTDKSERAWDLIKLAHVTNDGLNYRFGVFVDFKTGIEFNNEKPFDLIVFEKEK
jgi:hypothetical protein